MNQPENTACLAHKIELPAEYLTDWNHADSAQQQLNRHNLCVRAAVKAKRQGYQGERIELVCNGQSLALADMSLAGNSQYACVVTDFDLQKIEKEIAPKKAVGSFQRG